LYAAVKEGEARGRIKGRIEMAQNLLEMGMGIDEIARAAGFTLEEVQGLQNKMNVPDSAGAPRKSGRGRRRKELPV
jgi:hypothetical protein